jgi:putative oxidoreductase
MRFLSRYQLYFYALLRVVAGVTFTFHGLQKLFGLFGKAPVVFADKPQMWIGGLIELVCGVAIAAGLFTRWTAFLASGTMAVAYWQFHVGKELAGGHWLPVANNGDAAVLYCFVFLFVAALGPGPASLDRVFKIDN